MSIILALLFIFIGGVINGSFATPMKYIEKWHFENIWLLFAIWTFIIIPWFVIFILAPQIFQIYARTNSFLIIIMLLGGFFFGVGQICFVRALSMIGLGLGFVINIGLGMCLGFLLPLIIQHPDQIKTPFGIVTLLGTFLALLGLLFSTYAGHLRDVKKSQKAVVKMVGEDIKPSSKKIFYIGVLLAVVAGLASAGQNFSFSITHLMQLLANDMGATPLGSSVIMWPGFLLCSFIPYAFYTLYLIIKYNSLTKYTQPGSAKYYLYTFIMGVFWYGSLILYSKASQIIGKLGPLVGWPLFMVLIILVSNYWGWRHQEWAGASRKSKQIVSVGLILLIVAMIVLGYSSSLSSK